MERLTVTTIDKLQVGDRFYKAADRQKAVWTKVQHDVKITNFQTYKYFALKDGSRHPEAISKTTSLIFLKHKT